MCCSKGFLKRTVPFFATFALGLFIASFFVQIAAPNFRFGRGFRHREYDRQIQAENQRLKEKLSQIEQQNDVINVQSDLDENGNFKVIVPPPPPAAPIAPRAVR